MEEEKMLSPLPVAEEEYMRMQWQLLETHFEILVSQLNSVQEQLQDVRAFLDRVASRKGW